jgi:tRNA pseudouridine38-40 synthase
MEKNFKLTVAYEGTNFRGWQRQSMGPTIQELLELAVGRVCAHPVTIHGSGRTDAGVHAQGQVASFKTTSPRSPAQILAGANTLLPREIAVIKAEEVDLSFHARFSARGKCYSYDFSSSPVRDPLTLRQAWPVGPNLDWAKLKLCFPFLLGERDFSSFQSKGSEVQSPVRSITHLELSFPGPRLARLYFYATGFLRHMARAITGTLYNVARGQLAPEDLSRILEARDRRQAGLMAPAQGLCLRRVYYEDWPF